MPLRPPAVPFWGSGPAEAARLFLFGAPLELTVSGSPGTANGPPAVRRASHNIESYSPTLQGDLFDAGLADLGDLDLAGPDLEAALAEVERTTAELLGRGACRPARRPGRGGRRARSGRRRDGVA
jgi:arginase family enzyme